MNVLPVPGPDRLRLVLWELCAASLGPIAGFAALGLAPWWIASGALLSLCSRRSLRTAPTLGPVTHRLLLLVVWAAIAVLWSPAPASAAAKLAELAAMLLPGPILAELGRQLPPPRRARLARRLLAGYALGLILLGIDTFANMALFRLVHGLSWHAPFKTNFLDTAATAMVLATLLAAAILDRGGRRPWALACLAVFTVTALATPSLSAKTGMLIALATLPLARRWPQAVRRGLGAALIAGFVLAPPLAKGLERAGLEDAQALPLSSRHRVEIWDFTADRIRERPLFGHGWDSSRHIDNHGRVSRFGAPGGAMIPLHPHNLFLQVWLELGIPGVAIMLSLTLALVAATSRLDPRAQPYALAGFAAALAMQSTAFGASQGWWMAAMSAAAMGFSFFRTAAEPGPPPPR